MDRPMLPLAAVLVLALSACASDDEALRENLEAAVGDEDAGLVPAAEEIPDEPVEVIGDLIDPEGNGVGEVWLRDADVGTEIEVEVSGLTPGFHPMYLYDAAVCETESRSAADPGLVGPFLSVGDVVQELPSVLVLANGVGSTTTLITVDLAELLEGDGTALIVTEAAESLSDVPPPPVAPLDSVEDAEIIEEPPVINDTGSRVACGAIGGEEI